MRFKWTNDEKFKLYGHSLMNPNAQGIKILKIVSTYFNIFHNRNPWSGKYVIDLKELLVCVYVGRILSWFWIITVAVALQFFKHKVSAKIMAKWDSHSNTKELQ